jgi:hypothetical protein
VEKAALMVLQEAASVVLEVAATKEQHHYPHFGDIGAILLAVLQAYHSWAVVLPHVLIGSQHS